jgi:phage terminase large subunit-like protein
LVKICTTYKLNNGEIKEAILQYMEKNYGISRDGNIEFGNTFVDKVSGAVISNCYLQEMTITIEDRAEKEKQVMVPFVLGPPSGCI